jgi:hypothetical protein
MPSATAFEFAGTRSFVVFEGTGFRFIGGPELSAKENEEHWEGDSYHKIPVGSKVRTDHKKRQEVAQEDSVRSHLPNFQRALTQKALPFTGMGFFVFWATLMFRDLGSASLSKRDLTLFLWQQ